MCSVNTTTLEINVLPQHVSTQESHHQADYLRTIKCITLYSIIHVTIAFLFCSLSVFITDDRNTAAAAPGDDDIVHLECMCTLQGLLVQCDYMTWYIIHISLLQ